MGKEQAGIRVPGFVIKAAIKLVQQSVWKRAKMDINPLKPIEHVDKCEDSLPVVASGFRYLLLRASSPNPLVLDTTGGALSCRCVLLHWRHRAFVPALFCHGEHDNFIGVHHSREM